MQSINNLRKARTQGGFTLIELLIVIGILAILLAITLLALNPTQHFQGARNSQRSSDVTAILDGIYEYEAAHSGNLPGSVSSLTAGTTYDVQDEAGANIVDLCGDLVPTYLADLPLDPDSTYGTKTGSTACAGGGDTYKTGYTLSRSASSNRITVSAPHAEGSANISVTR